MQHILFKIYSHKISWSLAKSYNSKRETLIHRNIKGISTKKLSSNDFRRLAYDMDRAGIKTIRFISIDGNLYLDINS